MINIEIQNVSFDGEGNAEVAFYLPDADVKGHGLARMQTLIISKGGQYDDELDAVLEAAKLLIADVLEDFDALPSAFITPDVP